MNGGVLRVFLDTGSYVVTSFMSADIRPLVPRDKDLKKRIVVYTYVDFSHL